MSENTNQVDEKKGKKVAKKIQKVLPKSDKVEVNTKKLSTIENKSVQNKVIDNIKHFISKIIEMQEKVRLEEKEEKQQKKRDNLKKEEPKHLLEYYDLPFRYNETMVKILAQTPKRLFVYWDMADKDRQTYLNAFGEHFFEDTYPVLLVHNENKNYTSEIAIHDFANSWYLDISDSRDKYTIQLGRKFKFDRKPQINPEIEKTNLALTKDYLFIAMSNKLEVPNDHILFEEFKPQVTYRNVKTHAEEVKNMSTARYSTELKNLYEKLYDETMENGKIDLMNPSSMGTSSSIAK